MHRRSDPAACPVRGHARAGRHRCGLRHPPGSGTGSAAPRDPAAHGRRTRRRGGRAAAGAGGVQPVRTGRRAAGAGSVHQEAPEIPAGRPGGGAAGTGAAAPGGRHRRPGAARAPRGRFARSGGAVHPRSGRGSRRPAPAGAGPAAAVRRDRTAAAGPRTGRGRAGPARGAGRRAPGHRRRRRRVRRVGALPAPEQRARIREGVRPPARRRDGRPGQPEAAAQALPQQQERAGRAALGPRAAAGLRARGDNDDRPLAGGGVGLAAPVAGIQHRRRRRRGPGIHTGWGCWRRSPGRRFLLGEVVLRGAMLAIGEAGRSGEPAQFQIVARDAAAEGAGRARGVRAGARGGGHRRGRRGRPPRRRERAGRRRAGAAAGRGAAGIGPHRLPGAAHARGPRRRAGPPGAGAWAPAASPSWPPTPPAAGGWPTPSAAPPAPSGGRITARASYAAGASAFTAPDRPAEARPRSRRCSSPTTPAGWS